MLVNKIVNKVVEIILKRHETYIRTKVTDALITFGKKDIEDRIRRYYINYVNPFTYHESLLDPFTKEVIQSINKDAISQMGLNEEFLKRKLVEALNKNLPDILKREQELRTKQLVEQTVSEILEKHRRL